MFGAQLFEQLATRGIRQRDVTYEQIEGFSAGERARLLGVPSCLDVVSAATQQARENFAGVVMILHQEQPQLFVPRRSYVGDKPAYLRMGLGDCRQFKAKGRA